MQPVDFSDLMQSLTSALPNIGLALLLLLVGYIAGKILYSLTYRLLRRLRFDDAATRVGVIEGLEEAGFAQTPSKLMASLIHWATLLSFALLAVDALGLNALLIPLQAIISFLPRVIASGIAFVLGLLLSQIAGRATQATLISLGIEFHDIGGRVVRSLVLVVTVLIAVDQLELDIGLLNDTFVGLLLVASGGIVLAFALGAQGITRNILSGFYARENLQAGDRVVINGQEGILEAIGPVYCEISQGDDVLLIPNTQLQAVDILIKAGQKKASD